MIDRHNRTMRARFLAGALLVGLVLAAAPPAAAYVRYKIKNSNITFAWKQTCVPIIAYPNDMLAMMPLAEVDAATTGAVRPWSAAGNSCTYLDLTLTDSDEPTPHAAHDNKNVLIFRTTNWCKLKANGECDPEMALVYDRQALALTSVIASTKTGEIRDVDIEVNAVNFEWADLVAHPELAGDQVHQDLQNALAHEVGHLIGLDHTCYYQSNDMPRPVDSNGDPLIYCSDATPEVRATTMFPSAQPGDIEKRTLAPDDQQALCEIYPLDANPMRCEPLVDDNSGGCKCAAAAPAGGETAAAFGVLAAGALILSLRRRRRRLSIG